MQNESFLKLKKISEKELSILRYEKLLSWLDKNNKYLSLEDLEETIKNKIDPDLKKVYSFKEIANLSRNQRDELHKKLFARERKRSLVFDVIKQLCIQRRLTIRAIKKDPRHFVILKNTLIDNNLDFVDKTIFKYIDDFQNERGAITQSERLELQFMIRDDYSSQIKQKLKDKELTTKEALSFHMQNESGIEKLGLQTLANEKSKLELLGISDTLSLDPIDFSLLGMESVGRIEWTEKQREAIEIFHDENIKTLVLFGGGRSGKTTVAVGLVFERNLTNANHQSIIARQNFNALKRSIIDQTINGFYKRTFGIEFKQNLSSPAKLTLNNNSTINLAGIEGSNKISGLDAHLGNEYGTIYLNETSQISYESFKLIMTRANDPNSQIKIIIDLNPTSMNHWVYKYFIEGIDPDTDEPLPNSILESFGVLQMNPKDNIKNLNPEYLNMIRSTGSANVRRFEHGEWANFNENSIFPIDWMQWIEMRNEDEKYDYVAIGVDPAVSSKETSDESGIIVCAMRREAGLSKYYVLEDLSGRYTPEQWSNIVVETYRRYKNIKASKNTVVVLEKNQGGDTLNAILRVANGGVNFPTKDEFTAKDKITRAMYISSIYEKRQVFHTQKFKKLEAQMSAMGVDEYLDHDDRADALIHSLTYLFKLSNKALGTLHLI